MKLSAAQKAALLLADSDGRFSPDAEGRPSLVTARILEAHELVTLTTWTVTTNKRVNRAPGHWQEGTGLRKRRSRTYYADLTEAGRELVKQLQEEGQ